MRTVLIVEPHADTRDLYVAYFEYEGYTVETAGTTDAALRIAARVDAVVTELLVPGALTEYEFLRAVKGAPSACERVVIVLTTQATERCRTYARLAGCDVFLPKPCLPSHLCAVVERTLRRRARRTAKAPLRRLGQFKRGA